MKFVFCLCLLASCAWTAALGQACNQPLGLSDGTIPDSSFGASSTQKWHDAHYARLNQQPPRTPGAWCSESDSSTPPRIWVELGGEFRITKIAIQGRNSSYSGMFTKEFKLYYQATPTSSFTQKFSADPSGAFTANSDKSSVVEHSVDFEASTVSLLATSYYPSKMACLRFELYGCPVVVDPCHNNGGCDQKCAVVAGKAECSCYAGYKLEGLKCVDIDECASATLNLCDNATTTCVNSVAGFSCQCKQSGMHKDPANIHRCIDIDECDVGNGGCDHGCHNTMRSFYCTCRSGYALQADGKACKDIDECALKTDQCDSAETSCKNTPGSYSCVCLKIGYQVDPHNRYTCVDINECLVNNGDCAHACHNVPGSHYCTCRNGFTLNSDNRTCADINECLVNNGGCAQTCNNIDGSFQCACKQGYRIDGLLCHDIDECLQSPCETKCTNTQGSYVCSCDVGFKLLSDGKMCGDIDECAAGVVQCRAHSRCLNSIGSYSCPCVYGYKEDAANNCIAVSCPMLSHIANGNVSPQRCLLASGNHLDDVCSYTCNTGYALSSSSTSSSKCNADGNWQYQSGSTPSCVRIFCNKIQPVAFASILPVACTSTGPRFNTKCDLFCNGAHSLIGPSSTQCDSSGNLSHDLSTSRCVPYATLKCPFDIVATLPTGAREMIVKMPPIVSNAVAQYITTNPAGAVASTHKYPVGRTLVQITAKNEAGHSVDCTFAVTVVDREAPVVSNCNQTDYYLTVPGASGTVTWPEPTFADNIGVTVMVPSLQNTQTRPAQTYFVSYSARDAQGNVAYCKFVVHVRAKFCSKDRMPGGDSASVFTTTNSAARITAFVSCVAPTTLSFDSGAFSYACNQGEWTPKAVPDCVGFSPDATPCPQGTRKVTIYGQTKCANCPKGSKYEPSSSDCVACPIGYYQDQQKQMSCAKCPNGTTTVNSGSKSATQCHAQCAPGSYSPNGFNSVDGCSLCPLGFYQERFGESGCTVCPENGVTPATGSKQSSECQLPARITEVIPADELVAVFVGDTVTIDCFGFGIPAPFVYITNATALPPASFRGVSKHTPLTTSNKYISGLRLEITNAKLGDNSQYKCSVDNQSNTGARDERIIRIEVRSNA